MGTVLIVDDDIDIRETIAIVLNEAGYEVQQAGDGIEALERVSEHRPCVMLLDMMMPRLNGDGVLQILRRSPELATLPVVVVSAYPGMVHGGASRILTKPIGLTALLDAVHEFCAPRAH